MTPKDHENIYGNPIYCRPNFSLQVALPCSNFIVKFGRQSIELSCGFLGSPTIIEYCRNNDFQMSKQVDPVQALDDP